MHAKSGLRVVLKWEIFRPDSVIAAVIPLNKTDEPNAFLDSLATHYNCTCRQSHGERNLHAEADAKIRVEIPSS